MLSNVSWYRMLFRFENTEIKESTRSSLLPAIPNNGLNCELAILIDAAAVKPVMTGKEIKSNKKPEMHVELFQMSRKMWRVKARDVKLILTPNVIVALMQHLI